MTFDASTIQISPCIVSKAKFALGLKNEQPKNCKRCSLDYWKRTIGVLCKLNEINDDNRVQIAEKKYDELIKCYKK